MSVIELLAEGAELKNQIRKLNSEVRKLKFLSEDLQQQLARSEEQLDKSKDIIKTKNRDLKQLRVETRQQKESILNMTLTQANIPAPASVEPLIDRSAEVESLTEQLHFSAIEHDKLLTQLKVENAANVEKYTQEIAQLKAELQSSQQKLEATEVEKTKLEQQISAKMNEKQATKALSEEIEGLKVQLQTKISEKEEQIQKLNSDHAREYQLLNQEIDKLKKERKGLSRELKQAANPEMQPANRLTMGKNLKVFEVRLMNQAEKDLHLIQLYDKFISAKEDLRLKCSELQKIQQDLNESREKIFELNTKYESLLKQYQEKTKEQPQPFQANQEVEQDKDRIIYQLQRQILLHEEKNVDAEIKNLEQQVKALNSDKAQELLNIRNAVEQNATLQLQLNQRENKIQKQKYLLDQISSTTLSEQQVSFNDSIRAIYIRMQAQQKLLKEKINLRK